MISAYDYYTMFAKPTVEEFLDKKAGMSAEGFWPVWQRCTSSTTSCRPGT